MPPTSIMTAANDDMFQAETGMDDEDDDDDGELFTLYHRSACWHTPPEATPVTYTALQCSHMLPFQAYPCPSLHSLLPLLVVFTPFPSLDLEEQS